MNNEGLNIDQVIQNGLWVVDTEEIRIDPMSVRLRVVVDASSRPDLIDIGRVYDLDKVDAHDLMTRWGVGISTDMLDHVAFLEVEIIKPVKAQFTVLFDLEEYLDLLRMISTKDTLVLTLQNETHSLPLRVNSNGNDLKICLQDYSDITGIQP